MHSLICSDFFGFQLQGLHQQKGSMVNVALAKRIENAQKFLCSVRPLPSFEKLRANQCATLIKYLKGSAQISTQMAASCLESLDSSLWKPEQLTEFQEILSQKVASLEDSGSVASTEKKQQDFRNVVFYLHLEHWQLLKEDKNAGIQAILRRAVDLGMRNPTESTWAVFAFLYWWGNESKQNQSEAALHEDFRILKSSLKNRLSAVLPEVEEEEPNLHQLPRDGSHLPPEISSKVDAAKLQQHDDFDVPGILQAARLLPLRKSHSAVSKSNAPSTLDPHGVPAGANPFQAGMQYALAMQGCLPNVSPRAVSIQLLPPAFESQLARPHGLANPMCSEPKQAPPPLPPLRAILPKAISGSQEGSQSEVAVANEDSKRLGNVSPSSKLPPENMSISAELEGLSETLGRRVQLAGPAQKRPAMAKKPRGRPPAPKEPADVLEKEEQPKQQCDANQEQTLRQKRGRSTTEARSKGLAKAKAQVKTKAATKSKKGKQTLSRADRKEKVLKKLTAKQRSDYKEGCASCRNTPYCTPSCWRRRGVTL